MKEALKYDKIQTNETRYYVPEHWDDRCMQNTLDTLGTVYNY